MQSLTGLHWCYRPDTGEVKINIISENKIYRYQIPNVCPTCLPAPNFRIDDSEPVFCFITGNEMSMGDFMINGKLVCKYFVRRSTYILGKWEEIANGYYHENKIVMSPVEPNGSYKKFSYTCLQTNKVKSLSRTLYV
jgi:hypothetical protein